jgi:MFS family permease
MLKFKAQFSHSQYGKAFMIIIMAVLFFFYEFVLQVSPSVMTDDLMRDFSLTAVGVSTLAAFFYYAYAPMQLPGGILYDRFGPRKMLTFAVAVCTLGALLFSQAHSFALAAVGRAMMGFGGAFSFVGVLLLAARWFPNKYFPVLAGIIQALGCIAAIVGQIPLAEVVGKFGWRPTLFTVFCIGVVLVILMPLIVRDYPKGAVIPEKKKIGRGEWENLRIIFRNKQTWMVALYTFFSWSPCVVFAALWGVKFLSEMYGVSITTAAEMISLVWIGVAVGSPLFGWWSEKLGVRNTPLFVAAFLGFLAAAIVLYVKLPMPLLLVVLFFFGIGASGQTLSFAVVRDNNPPSTEGTAMGFNNLACVIGGAIWQPFVGFLINLGWAGAIVGGVRVYSLANYQQALIVVPICYLLCAVFGRFLIKETYCKHVPAHK